MTEPTASDDPTTHGDPATHGDAAAPEPPPVQQQREELAETVGALAEKLDVPTRVKTAASDTVHSVEAKAKDNPQTAVIAGVVGLTVLGAIILIRRRRRSR